MNGVDEKDNVRFFFIFSKHLRILNEEKIFPVRNWYFSKRNMEKYQTAGRLVIRRPCPVVFGKNFLSVTLGYLRTL